MSLSKSHWRPVRRRGQVTQVMETRLPGDSGTGDEECTDTVTVGKQLSLSQPELAAAAQLAKHPARIKPSPAALTKQLSGCTSFTCRCPDAK